MSSRLASAAATLWFLGSAAGVAARDLFYSGSLQYASGRYTFEERSQSLYFFNGLRFATGPWAAQANLPLVLQIPSGTITGMAAEAGIGDAFLRVERELVRLRGGRPSLRLAAETKIPLSRANPTLGTGKWDFGAGVSLAKRLGGSFGFLDATYWKFGDPPGIDLRDAVAYGISFGRPAGRVGLLVSVTGYSRLVSGVEPPVQAGFFLSWWTRARRSFSAGAAFGLTDAAPDFSLSLGWRLGF